MPPPLPRKLLKLVYQLGDKASPPIIDYNTHILLSKLEAEWLAAQLGSSCNDTPLIANKTTDSISEGARTSFSCSDAWHFSHGDNALIKDCLKITLTDSENDLVKAMLNHDDRVISKDDLVRSNGREPEYYRGLEMCLSRLQHKFKKFSSGERLFRAVRNRGYCLSQKIKYK